MNKRAQVQRTSEGELKFKEEFSKRIKEERERLGFHINDFSELIGIHWATQFKYEAGSSLPKLYYLKKAAEIGVDIKYILGVDKG